MAKDKKAKALLDEAIVKKLELDNLRAVAMRVLGGGFTPESVGQDEFGATKWTEAIAILYRTLRLFREVRRPYGEPPRETLGYEWADRRFSRSEQARVPAVLQFLLELGGAAWGPRYDDYQFVEVRCQWTNWVLGAIPSKDDGGDVNVFRRISIGGVNIPEVMLPAYGLRAMAAKALPLIGKPAALAHHIRFRTVRVQSPKIEILVDGMVEEATHRGKGLKRSEAIVPWTAFTIAAWIPTSAISVAEYLRMLGIAGADVRFSPARSAGYGDFEVLGEA